MSEYDPLVAKHVLAHPDLVAQADQYAAREDLPVSLSSYAPPGALFVIDPSAIDWSFSWRSDDLS